MCQAKAYHTNIRRKIRELNTMNQSTYEDVVSYGIKLKESHQGISADDLKTALLAKFVGGKDFLPLSTSGCVCNPFGDCVAILWIVCNSLRKMFVQDKAKLLAVQEQIDRAVSFLVAIH
jgi:hypothetical protein